MSDFQGIGSCGEAAEEPKFRPWNTDEAIGKIVRFRKFPDNVVLISRTRNGRFGPTAMAPNWCVDLETLLEEYEQLDGSPCGVLTEEAGV